MLEIKHWSFSQSLPSVRETDTVSFIFPEVAGLLLTLTSSKNKIFSIMTSLVPVTDLAVTRINRSSQEDKACLVGAHT